MSCVSTTSSKLVDGSSSSSSSISRKRQIDDLSTASTSEKCVDKLQVSEDSSPRKQSNLRSCEGIIVNPTQKIILTPLIYFHKYSALRISTSYCFQNLGPYPQLYSRECNNDGKMRTKKTDTKGIRCDSCQDILASHLLVLRLASGGVTLEKVNLVEN
eukprot:scaffold219940_cov69-Attheya_sp.AAC.1